MGTSLDMPRSWRRLTGRRTPQLPRFSADIDQMKNPALRTAKSGASIETCSQMNQVRRARRPSRAEERAVTTGLFSWPEPEQASERELPPSEQLELPVLAPQKILHHPSPGKPGRRGARCPG